MYEIIDQAADIWEMGHIEKIYQQELSYMGDLLEIESQIQNRIQSVAQTMCELNSHKKWKNPASQLLSSNYEQEMINMSEQCNFSIKEAHSRMEKYLMQDS